MPDSDAPEPLFIETNESTEDASDKFWEVDVPAATRCTMPVSSLPASAAVGSAIPFSDDSSAYLRLGTTAANPLFQELSALKAAVDDDKDVDAAFDALKTQLEALKASQRLPGADGYLARIATARASYDNPTGDTPDEAAARTVLRAVSQEAIKERRAATLQRDRERGDDLASLVTDYYDDTRYRGSKGEPQCPWSEGERQTESGVIHSKGGWRDHTNGNRVSTTRGDKVEVIRGNYSLLVLGRQDEPGGGAKWESGGGHFARDNDTQTPGAVFEIRWVQNPWGGTWRCIEETTKGDVITRYQGNSEEVWYGAIKRSITGTESPAPVIGGEAARRTGHIHPETGAWISSTGSVELRQNPHIYDQTWASKIESYTGSVACPVPEIIEKTWATTITSYTGTSAKRITSITDETWATTITEKTDAANTTSTTNISGSITETTTASAVTSTTTVTGTSTDTSIITNQVEVTLNAAANTAVAIAPVKTDFNMNAAQFCFDINPIIKMDIAYSSLLGSFNIGILRLDLDLCPFIFEVHGGVTMKLTQAVELEHISGVKLGTKLAGKIENGPYFIYA